VTQASKALANINAKYARAERYVAPTKSREQCIAQIFAVADDWGMARPTITERTSDESLLKLCKKLDRQGAKLAQQ
jgi:hypothetical protein